MHVSCYSLLAGARAARGVAVIIDVFRAFTCAPLLFSLGVPRIILTATPTEAFALKRQNPSLLLIGEVDGIPIEGFDLGNSPSQILKTDPSFFQGKTVVQRTSAGVQGAIAALGVAEKVLLGSFVLAEPVARHILARQASQVSLVAMGWNLEVIAPEDEYCARYIAHLLRGDPYDHNQALREIIFHESTQRFSHGSQPHFPPEDPILCLQRNTYDFVLEAHRDGELIYVDCLKD